MRRIALLCALAFLLTAPASGQEWTEYQAIGWLDKDGKGIRYRTVYQHEIHGLKEAPVPAR